MAGLTTATTSLSPEEVIMRSIQFFTGSKWRPQTQSERSATFVGQKPFPVGYLVLALVTLWSLILPIIFLILAARRTRSFQNIVVTATRSGSSTQVTITHESGSRKIVERFVAALPSTKTG